MIRFRRALRTTCRTQFRFSWVGAGAATARKSQALCEAQFFIGERKLLEGDKAGARRSFRACVDRGQQGVFEDDLARLRLIVLGE